MCSIAKNWYIYVLILLKIVHCLVFFLTINMTPLHVAYISWYNMTL